MYSGPDLLLRWMDKVTMWQNPVGLCIIEGWRSGDVVRHPVWIILSWGPSVQPLEAWPSFYMGCVDPSHVLLWEAHHI
jgi:hypothetical protein